MVIKSMAMGDGERCRIINKQLKDKLGIRDAMTEDQLLAAIRFIRQRFPRTANG
jgi:hypothetical protein